MGEIRDAIKHGWGEGHKDPAKRTTWDQHKATSPEYRSIDDVRPGDTEILPASQRPAKTSSDRLFNWSIGLTIAPLILAVIVFIVLLVIVFAILT